MLSKGDMVMSTRDILIFELDYTPAEADAILAEIYEDPDAIDNYNI